MRTPPRLSVASDRPLMTHEPRSVKVIQSPWRQTPGNSSKYAARYREPEGSFQKETGIDGIGLVMTSSPCSPISGSPEGEYASTAQPRWRHESSPSQTGTSGDAPTKAVQTSVPPETDCRWTDGLIAS